MQGCASRGRQIGEELLGAGAPSCREAKGGAFDFFHHKRAASTITEL